MLVSLRALSDIAGNSGSLATVPVEERFVSSSSEVNKMITRTMIPLRSKEFNQRDINDMIKFPLNGERNSDAGRGFLKTK